MATRYGTRKSLVIAHSREPAATTIKFYTSTGYEGPKDVAGKRRECAGQSPKPVPTASPLTASYSPLRGFSF